MQLQGLYDVFNRDKYRVTDRGSFTIESERYSWGDTYSHCWAKTDKIKRFLVNPQLRKEVRKYVRKSNLKNEQYLFPSRKGNGPITRVQAYRVLNKAAEMADIPDVGTHTLRKTFGYLHYQKFKDIALLQQILNHSNPKDTMIYIGLTQDLMDETLMDFYY